MLDYFLFSPSDMNGGSVEILKRKFVIPRKSKNSIWELFQS